MARLARGCPIVGSQHIIQRGNNHQICFADDADLYAYANWLKACADKFSVKTITDNYWMAITGHPLL